MNLRPAVYKTAALPTELSQHTLSRTREYNSKGAKSSSFCIPELFHGQGGGDGDVQGAQRAMGGDLNQFVNASFDSVGESLSLSTKNQAGRSRGTIGGGGIPWSAFFRKAQDGNPFFFEFEEAARQIVDRNNADIFGGSTGEAVKSGSDAEAPFSGDEQEGSSVESGGAKYGGGIVDVIDPVQTQYFAADLFVEGGDAFGLEGIDFQKEVARDALIVDFSLSIKFLGSIVK